MFANVMFRAADNVEDGEVEAIRIFIAFRANRVNINRSHYVRSSSYNANIVML